MSDRLAVMNAGRIEQVGTPAEVYENPSSAFVAGFVGVSNTLSGEVAKGITGSDRPITIRPEKIHLREVDDPTGTDEVSVTGRVRDVVYVGATTRYVVELDPGGQLVVLQQNLTTSSMQVLEAQGKRVRLAWDRQHSRSIDVGHGGTGATAPDEGGEDR